jgi:hypothetical protein
MLKVLLIDNTFLTNIEPTNMRGILQKIIVLTDPRGLIPILLNYIITNQVFYKKKIQTKCSKDVIYTIKKRYKGKSLSCCRDVSFWLFIGFRHFNI